MKNITEQENKIFKEWRDSDFIVKDGIVDKQKFLQTNKKVLVIMKETNDYVNKEEDLRVFLQNGATWKTWNNIVRWTYALQNIEKDIDLLWNEISTVNETKRKNQLSTIGSINLKKRPGGSKTNKSELISETKKNNEYLKKQLEIYSDLDFILCGSRDVADEVQKNKLLGDIEFKQHKDTYVQIAEYGKTLVISYYHPQVRGKGSGKKILFENLIKSVQDYLSNQDNTFSIL